MFDARLLRRSRRRSIPTVSPAIFACRRKRLIREAATAKYRRSVLERLDFQKLDFHLGAQFLRLALDASQKSLCRHIWKLSREM